jgi:P27 family predicted phage terminase small subunit
MTKKPEQPGKLLTMPAPAPQPKPAKMPPWLRGEARRYWRRHAAELTRRGLLDNFTAMYFALVCSCWRSLREISDRILRDGVSVSGPGGRPVAHPLLAAQNRELKLFRAFARDMGMLPKNQNGK